MGGYKVIKLAVEYLLKYDEKIKINNRRSKEKNLTVIFYVNQI